MKKWGMRGAQADISQKEERERIWKKGEGRKKKESEGGKNVKNSLDDGIQG